MDLANQTELTIEYAELPPDRDGEYLHDRGLIRLRPGMVGRHHRSVLAHELGHAAFGDTPSPFGPIAARQERRADEWASLRLIRKVDYELAERLHGAHPGAMAIDLGVTRSIVTAYQRVLARELHRVLP